MKYSDLYPMEQEKDTRISSEIKKSKHTWLFSKAWRFELLFKKKCTIGRAGRL